MVIGWVAIILIRHKPYHPLLIYIERFHPLEPRVYVITFSFLQPCLPFLHYGMSPLMYIYIHIVESLMSFELIGILR